MTSKEPFPFRAHLETFSTQSQAFWGACTGYKSWCWWQCYLVSWKPVFLLEATCVQGLGLGFLAWA